MTLSTSVLHIVHLEIMIRSFFKISVSQYQKNLKKVDLKLRGELELQKSNKELIRSSKPSKKPWKHIEQVRDFQRKRRQDPEITRLLHRQDLIIFQMRKSNLTK